MALNRRALRYGLGACLLLTLVGVAGCTGPGYYFQAVSGQLKLMRARQDVAQVLADPETDPAISSRLRAARDMLAFAEQALDLPANDSYSSFVRTGQSAVVWNVIVAPEFALEPRKWCFPVAGCVPYRGYFDEEHARKFAERMSSKGLDVSVQGATAYSTLGWFSDPLLDTMLQGDETRLAGTLFHELAHQRFYLKGDTAFSEAYASFVESAGVRSWLLQQGSHGVLGRWEQSQLANKRFRRLQAVTRSRLDALYRSDLAEADMRTAKQGVFKDMTMQYEEIVEQEWNGHSYFAGWVRTQRNNAALALYRDYQQGFCAFSALFAEVGGHFRDFHQRVAQMATMKPLDRASWLDGQCESQDVKIAPEGDL